MPQCGALSLLQKTLHYRENPAETAATLNVELWVLVTDFEVASYGFLAQSFFESI
jgi:hypothetical protein